MNVEVHDQHLPEEAWAGVTGWIPVMPAGAAGGASPRTMATHSRKISEASTGHILAMVPAHRESLHDMLLCGDTSDQSLQEVELMSQLRSICIANYYLAAKITV